MQLAEDHSDYIIAMWDVPRTRTSLGDHSFTVAGPHLWNNLLLHLRYSQHTFPEFRQLLFCWGQRFLVTVCFLSTV